MPITTGPCANVTIVAANSGTAISTALITIGGGLVVFVLGQLVVKLLIEPVSDMRKTIGQISHALIEYSTITHNVDVSSKDQINEVEQQLSELSSTLHAHLYLVPCYPTAACLFWLPSRDSVLNASKHLTWIAKNFSSYKKEDLYEQITEREAAICDSLKIYFPDERRWPKDD